jgi:hypothetical protein
VKHASCRLVLVAALAASPSVYAASELESARKDAQTGTATLEQRPCPVLGDRNYLRGLSDPQQLIAAAEQERTYEEGALRQLEQIARDPQLSNKQRPPLLALASWSISASLANWSMLQLAQQALADPLVAQGKPYPTAGIESARERLRQVSENGSLNPEAADIVRRQSSVLERCSKGFATAVFKLNQPQFEAAIESAGSGAELDRVEKLYRYREAAAGNYGGDSLDRLTARRTAIAEIERVARENAAVVSAAEAAKRQEENQRWQAENAKRQAELEAKLPGYLAVAKRFTEAAQSGNERAALAQLSNDVVMTTPQGNYRGINNVADAVRRQSASGSSGSLGNPRIESGRILANGNSSGFRITTYFSFDEANKISRIDISL